MERGDSVKTVTYRPFLKWPGNKFHCLAHLIPKIPMGRRLIEPFTGSGAVFMNTSFQTYLLGEINPDLIGLYTLLQQQGAQFIEDCAALFVPENNIRARYYALRDEFNQETDGHRRATLFLYLNRHGYNGLCRYNNSGLYNVPFGLYHRPYFPRRELYQFYQKSQVAQFVQGDFSRLFLAAQAGDVIYCDPPYSPRQQDSNFSKYARQHFGEPEHLALAQLARETALRGITVLVSNHDTVTTREYYQGANIFTFRVSRLISRDARRRQPVQELVAVFSSD